MPLAWARRTRRSRARCISLASVGRAIAFSCTVVSITTCRKSAGLAAPIGSRRPGSPESARRACPPAVRPCVGASASATSGRTEAYGRRTPRRRTAGSTGSRPSARIIPTALISDRRAPIRGDLLDDVGTARLTPDEAQTISSIVAKRAELFPSIELAVEIEALKAQLAAVLASTPPSPIRRPFVIAYDRPRRTRLDEFGASCWPLLSWWDDGRKCSRAVLMGARLSVSPSIPLSGWRG